MKILAIVQAWDSKHPSGGFTVGWLEEFSRRIETLIVLALEQRESAFLPNIKIYSLGKEKYRGFGCCLFYLWQWHKKIRRIVRDDKPDIVFTHMTPIYSVMAYPYVFIKRIPITTWFIHPRVSLILKLAHFLSARIFSATINSYPYYKNKLIPLGHGIDTKLFSPSMKPLAKKPLILCVGRLSSIKDHVTLLRSAYLLKEKVKSSFVINILGNVVTKDDQIYFNWLKNLIIDLNIKDLVSFKPAVPYKELVDRYGDCSVHVNPTKPGSLDKTALEAMACGRPSLVASPAFSETLGDYKNKLLFQYHNERDLADKLFYFLSASESEREKIGLYLRERVINNHSLERLAEKLVINLQKC